MSKWRTMWRDAIRASARLALDRPKGEIEFHQLLEEHPSDAMILYERGEAYEYLAASSRRRGQTGEWLEQLALAEHDYKLASEGLVEPHWREAADEALTSVACAREGGRLPPEGFLRRNIHRLHQLPQLPHAVRADAMSAVARFDSEPRLATADLGVCIERLVWILAHQADPSCPPREDLEKLIERLPSDTPAGIRDSVNKARLLRNDAVHARQVTDDAHFRPMLDYFMAFATWSEPRLGRRPVPRGDKSSKGQELGQRR